MSTNTKHTPGPWTVDTSFHLYEKDKYYNITGGCGYWSLEEDDREKGLSITGVISDADAKLIAAAPSLLEALQNLVEWVEMADKGERPGYSFDQAKTAIKKATE